MRFVPLRLALAAVSIETHIRVTARPQAPPLEQTAPGVSIIVPERGTPELLDETLTALLAACDELVEPFEIIVIVNGEPAKQYAALTSRYANIQWHFHQAPLGYSGAISAGLSHARYDWSYLLNSDMRLDAAALRELVPHRAPGVFAIASQIFFVDTQRRREETGWTDFVSNPNAVEIYDRFPDSDSRVRGNLYAGGGSSLFRTSVLRRYQHQTRDYAPFYFEDVDWGVRAWSEGWQILFCPTSKAWHHHRSTVKKYYDPQEIERIIRRNSLLFDLRHAWTGRPRSALLQSLAAEEDATQLELSGIPLALRVWRSRRRTVAARRGGLNFERLAIEKYPDAAGESAAGTVEEQPHALAIRHPARSSVGGDPSTGTDRNRSRPESLIAAVDSIAARTADLPRVLWIELTSRCPFDCIFCSRKLLRGAGKHLDFDLYSRLIGELRADSTNAPDIIRLNYSGESAHYLMIVEASRLAAETGAQVELVTTLAALPAHKLRGLVHSGITRLTISLHTLEPQQFDEIYRFSSVEVMRQRIEEAMMLARTAPRPIEIDFAFVAMQRNLRQLGPVAAYARGVGVTRLAVHPVIRRDPIAEKFVDELDGDRLRPAFLAELKSAIDTVRSANPELRIEVSTPEIDSHEPLGTEARYFPGELPANARIHSCEQNPWETIHILADGSAVTCEERDRIGLGNLHDQTLRELWHGRAYQQFRNAYIGARDEHCRRCPYKQAYLGSPPPDRFRAPDLGAASLLDGWFDNDGDGVRWSRKSAQMQLRASGPGQLRIRGFLPRNETSPNHLRISVADHSFVAVAAAGIGLREFFIDQTVDAEGLLPLRFDVERVFIPALQGSADTRRLGFALLQAEFSPDGAPIEPLPDTTRVP